MIPDKGLKMSELINETISESTIASVISEPRSYAGKFGSVEELETAYGHAVNAIREANELKKMMVVPDDYSIPDGVSLRDIEISEMKSMAKNAGLNQAHFEKMTKDMHSRIQSGLSAFEESKKSLGEENLNVITDYVKRVYPESLHDTVLTKLIKDKNAMSDAMRHRNELLNSQAPGMSSGSTSVPKSSYDGEGELHKVALEYKKNPNENNRNRYINLAREVSEERFKK